MSKPSIPPGTRDFLPLEMQKRNFIFDTIKKYFHLYGFVQIETPAVEKLDTLLGKYGDEGDKLIFKILNSGIGRETIEKKVNSKRVIEENYEYEEVPISKKEQQAMADAFINMFVELMKHDDFTEKALRYDLTVPFARYVVQHRNDITFPFKRYQIQPVWRADRPQKGRYREFFQCDADIIGSDSLLNEIQLIQLMDNVYNELGIPVTIKLNNRKIFGGIAEFFSMADKVNDLVTILDKIEKIGELEVKQLLREKGITDEMFQLFDTIILSAVRNFFDGGKLILEKNIENDLGFISDLKKHEKISPIFNKGLEELEFIFNFFKTNSLKKACIEFDIRLARGLNYYTGSIIEVKANAGTLTSSITGGGRYDDLTGIFGLPNVSGVGISFGIDRIFDIMNELNLFEGKLGTTAPVKVLFLNLGDEEANHSLQLVTELRKAGISADVYPDKIKEVKQYDYAVKLQVPFICIVRENNVATKIYELKNIVSKERWNLSIEKIIDELLKYKTT